MKEFFIGVVIALLILNLIKKPNPDRQHLMKSKNSTDI